MKKNIRQGVFETNSSSTHSICIAVNPTLEPPDTMEFRFGEFGWEVDTLSSLVEKANYLYTGLYANDRKDDIGKIGEILSAKGINATFQEPSGNDEYYETGYVDHSNELTDFLDEVTSNEGALMSYLFSPLSFILTGNDNDECDVGIDVPYEHKSFYKGN